VRSRRRREKCDRFLVEHQPVLVTVVLVLERRYHPVEPLVVGLRELFRRFALQLLAVELVLVQCGEEPVGRRRVLELQPQLLEWRERRCGRQRRDLDTLVGRLERHLELQLIDAGSLEVHHEVSRAEGPKKPLPSRSGFFFF
jgi:hypothetical protein